MPVLCACECAGACVLSCVRNARVRFYRARSGSGGVRVVRVRLSVRTRLRSFLRAHMVLVRWRRRRPLFVCGAALLKVPKALLFVFEPRPCSLVPRTHDRPCYDLLGP